MIVELLFPPSLGMTSAMTRGEVFADLLAMDLDVRARLSVASSYRELEERILAAEVDVAWAPPLVCARVLSSARAVLRAVRGGHAGYRAAWICRYDRDLTLDGLHGERAAWVDQMSCAGYLLPLAHLRELGADPAQRLGVQSFHGSYVAALQAILRGDAEVSAVYCRPDGEDDARTTLERLVVHQAASLKAFAYTPPVPGDGLVITRRLSAHLTDELLQRIDTASPGAYGGAAMLTLLDAQRLVPSVPADYTGLLDGVGRRVHLVGGVDSSTISST